MGPESGAWMGVLLDTWTLTRRTANFCQRQGMHDDDIDGAEVAALKQVEERAELANGQTVLELGCGWGSLVSCGWLNLALCDDAPDCVHEIAVSVDGGALPQKHLHQRVQLKWPEGPHRGQGQGAWPQEPHHHHRRHERLCPSCWKDV